MKQQCNLCGSLNIEVVFDPVQKHALVNSAEEFIPTALNYGIFYKTARCRDCGILFSLLEKSVDIRQLYLESNDNLYVSQAKERTCTCERVLSQIQDLAGHNCCLLDVGCSYGFFLDLARGKGMKVSGVEISRDACSYCREKLNLDVFCGSVEQSGFPCECFDIVCAIEVIEHIEDPKDFILQIRRVLKPGGILYLVTPNIKSLSGKILGYNWWAYRRMHLYYFSKETLYGFLNRHGFSLISSFPYKKTFKLDYIMHQLSGYNKTGYNFLSCLTNILKINNLNISSSFGDIAVIARKN